jgi:hypothetical protein
MSKFKIVASIVGLAFIAAFITKPIDVRGEIAKEPAPVAAKADRSQITVNSWACADEPGPYGCQWRTPSKRVIVRTPRPI